MPLSSQLSSMLRAKVVQFNASHDDPELAELKPLFDLQLKNSYIPKEDEFLIEYYKSREGYHLIMYPFEGRFVHEGMGSITREAYFAYQTHHLHDCYERLWL